MFWLPGQNTTIGMPTPLNGHGRIRRCVDGSLNMPPEFSAGFHAEDTSLNTVRRRNWRSEKLPSLNTWIRYLSQCGGERGLFLLRRTVLPLQSLTRLLARWLLPEVDDS